MTDDSQHTGSGADRAAPAATPADPRPRLHEMERREASRAVAVGLLKAVAAAVVVVVVYYALPLADLNDAQLAVRIVGAVLIVVAVVVWEIRAVSRAALPQLRAIEALAVAVVVVAIAFASAYLHLSAHDAASFSEPLAKTSALYFTLTTLATVGYGDIHAKSDAARLVVMIQMVTNIALLGAVIRLITTMARQRAAVPNAPADDLEA